MNENLVKRYRIFNKSDINDTILKRDYFAHGIKLHFKRGAVVFYPTPMKMDNYRSFYEASETGDIVLKKSFEDTLILKKKDGEILKFTFRKFENKK